MKSMKKIMLLALSAFGSMSVYAAGTATGSFQVNANISDTCQVSTTGTVLNFNYDPFTAVDTTGTTNISVQCTNLTNYDVSLSTGSSTSYTTRTMQLPYGGGFVDLNYNLFTDATLSTVWGDGSGTTGTLSGVADGTVEQLTVNASVPKNQFVQAGTYTDSITVTVTP